MTQDDSCLNSFIQRVADYYQIVSSSRIPATQYEIDFRDLKNLSQDLKQSDDIEYQSCAGMIAENRKKNRYKDIAPFDATRVKLTMTNNDPNSDYINASFIQGADNQKSYIASQGPLPHTVLDFWQMLWQYNVNVVVMVCREIELGKKKCERYWANRGETKTFGSITVTSESDDNLEEGYCLRVMKVVNGQETRYIKQFHYTSWPDHGVPKTCYEIITLINHVRDVQSYSEDVRTPLCIHCSAGCGRTGAAIVLDYVRNLLDHKRVPPNLKTFDIIAQMRRQRPAIVQTKEQYEFVNVAISELFRIYMRTKTLKYKEFSVGYQGEEYVNVSISKDKPRNGNSLPRTAQYENFEPRSNGVGAPTWSDAPEEPPPKPKRPLSTMFPPSSNLDNTANSRKQSMPAVLGPPAKLNLRQRPAALAPVKSAPTEHSAVMPTKPNPAAKPAPPAKPQEAKRPAPTKPRRSFRRMPDRSSGEDSAPNSPVRQAKLQTYTKQHQYCDVTLPNTNDAAPGIQSGNNFQKYKKNNFYNEVDANGRRDLPPTVPIKTVESQIPLDDDAPPLPERTEDSYQFIQVSETDAQTYESFDSTTLPVTTPENADARRLSAPSPGPNNALKNLFDKATTSVLSKVGATISKTGDDTGGGAPISTVDDRKSSYTPEARVYNGQDMSFPRRLFKKVRGPRKQK